MFPPFYFKQILAQQTALKKIFIERIPDPEGQPYKRTKALKTTHSLKIYIYINSLIINFILQKK